MKVCGFMSVLIPLFLYAWWHVSAAHSLCSLSPSGMITIEVNVKENNSPHDKCSSDRFSIVPLTTKRLPRHYTTRAAAIWSCRAAMKLS